MMFGKVIKQVRNTLSITQEQLARELKVSFSTVNRWENLKSNPSPLAKENFLVFCSKNNIDLDSFVIKVGMKND